MILYDYFKLFSPLLCHMVISEVVAIVAGPWLDTTACTTLVALFVIPAALWMYAGDRNKSAQPVEKRSWRHTDFRFALCCLLGGGVLNLLWSGILNALQIGTYFSNETQEQLLAGAFVLQLVGLGVLVPLSEELIFRGLIYQRMKRLLPWWASAVLASAIFALYHGNPIQIIFAFPMALALIWTLEHGHSLRYPVLFHMGANLTAVLLNLV
jgi:hypothetical protein